MAQSNHDHQDVVGHTDHAAWDHTAVLDLARELSDALEIDLPEAALEGVHTREHLIELVLQELGRRTAVEIHENGASTLRVRITTGNSPNGCYVERSLPWTPYALETIWDDAVHAGSGSVVNVTLPQGTARGSIVRLEQRLAPLRYRGVRVRVRADSAARP